MFSWLVCSDEGDRLAGTCSLAVSSAMGSGVPGGEKLCIRVSTISNFVSKEMAGMSTFLDGGGLRVLGAGI